MVANAHSPQLDLTQVRRRFAVSLKGATLQQSITHAGHLMQFHTVRTWVLLQKWI